MKRSWIGRVLIGSLLVWSLLVGFVHGQAVVVTTTMLESAVRALVGDTIQVVRLLPPGSCPGHFDLEPNQLRGLSEARVVVRHPFQASMYATLLKSGLLRERIAVVETAEPMTIPSQY
ncbi:MAG: zinc ABC transporter substrate-binding protein, partial [Verrucomicrobiota bacterium]|nr:zinc ABC transporter substrate-binding protein [Verrucomicrobiota bacterium]